VHGQDDAEFRALPRGEPRRHAGDPVKWWWLLVLAGVFLGVGPTTCNITTIPGGTPTSTPTATPTAAPTPTPVGAFTFVPPPEPSFNPVNPYTTNVSSFPTDGSYVSEITQLFAQGGGFTNSQGSSNFFEVAVPNVGDTLGQAAPTVPVYYCDHTQCLSFTIHCTLYTSCPLEGQVVYLKPGAQPQDGYNVGGEGHIATVDVTSGTVVSAYSVPTSVPTAGGSYTAGETLNIGYGGKCALGVYVQFTGTCNDAATSGGLPIAGMLIRPDEWLTADQHTGGPVDLGHAIAVTACARQSYIYPANSSVSGGTKGCPAYGAIIRLNWTDSQIASATVPGGGAVPNAAKVLLYTMAHYGLYVTDQNATPMSFFFEDDNDRTSLGQIGNWPALINQLCSVEDPGLNCSASISNGSYHIYLPVPFAQSDLTIVYPTGVTAPTAPPSPVPFTTPTPNPSAPLFFGLFTDCQAENAYPGPTAPPSCPPSRPQNVDAMATYFGKQMAFQLMFYGNVSTTSCDAYSGCGYYKWNTPGSNAYDAFNATDPATGNLNPRVPVDAVASCAEATAAAPNNIQSGAYDTAITEGAIQRRNAYNYWHAMAPHSFMAGVTVVRWCWEWNTDSSNITASQWIAAEQHMHDLSIAAGDTHSLWFLNPAGSGSNMVTGLTAYPGPTYIDWVGPDSYDKNQSGGYGGTAGITAIEAVIGPAMTAINNATGTGCSSPANSTYGCMPVMPIYVGETSSSCALDQDVYVTYATQAALHSAYPNLLGFDWFDQNHPIVGGGASIWYWNFLGPSSPQCTASLVNIKKFVLGTP
jgi:hypothetical protein